MHHNRLNAPPEFDDSGINLADPNDKRTDRVYGEVGLLGMFIPSWGMHLADVAEAQGDMIRRVEEISAQSRTGSQPGR